MPSTLEVDRPRDGVAVVRLNRPKQLNAINETMQIELGQTLADLGADRTAHAIVLTGAGRGFCAGIDMRDFGPECSGGQRAGHRPLELSGEDGRDSPKQYANCHSPSSPPSMVRASGRDSP